MEAYAKLEGRIGLNDDEASKREFLITELPCSLGRSSVTGRGGIIVDCNDVLLSRQHVEISWSQDGGWLLICLSKNGCTVDKKRYGKSAQIGLRNGSAIRIGNARLYFTLPVIEAIAVVGVPLHTENKKRSYSEALPETDEEGDLIMAMPGQSFLSARSATTTNNGSTG